MFFINHRRYRWQYASKVATILYAPVSFKKQGAFGQHRNQNCFCSFCFLSSVSIFLPLVSLQRERPSFRRINLRLPRIGNRPLHRMRPTPSLSRPPSCFCSFVSLLYMWSIGRSREAMKRLAEKHIESELMLILCIQLHLPLTNVSWYYWIRIQ